MGSVESFMMNNLIICTDNLFLPDLKKLEYWGGQGM